MENRTRKRAARCAAVWAAAVLQAVLLSGCGDTLLQKEAPSETFGEETMPTLPEKRPLEAKELAEFEAWLNEEANNGFLLSAYDDVRRADLNEVFYNGAGLAQQPLTEELRRAYEEQAGEIMTDTVRLTTGQMDAFLREKTGYGLADFENPPDWTYLEDFDIWMKDHGDTNRMGVSCDRGQKEGDGTIVLFCSVPGDPSYSWISEFTVTLAPGGDGFFFRKNEIRKGLILEQETGGKEEGFADPGPFDPAQISEFLTEADTSVAAAFDSWGDFSRVTEENLCGVWYCPAEGGDSETVLILSEEGARVYYPLLDCYGDRLYPWQVKDRSASGLCPALEIYFNGEDKGPLTYYIAGLELEFFWCNSQQTIFYRQGGTLQ